jgi:hypothetical protein
MSSIPHVRNSWTLGTVLAATTSVMSLLSMLIGGVWFAARLDESTKNIPAIILQVNQRARDVAVLQNQQHYTDMRYAEIMTELAKINEKLDRRRQEEVHGH